LLETNLGVSRRADAAGDLSAGRAKVHADKAYDFPRCRVYLRRRGTKVRIARRGVELSTKLGRHRWVVERTISWTASQAARAAL
jgi:IS5 family transposase